MLNKNAKIQQVLAVQNLAFAKMLATKKLNNAN